MALYFALGIVPASTYAVTQPLAPGPLSPRNERGPGLPAAATDLE